MINKPRWLIFCCGFAILAATALVIHQVKSRQKLGKPGVRVVAVPSYNEAGKPVSSQSVFLPEKVAGAEGRPVPISDSELAGLPADTTFGKRLYHYPDGFETSMTVVLMGTDRTSIHQPQFCLVGQGWGIDRTERIRFRINQAVPCEVPAIKLSTSICAKDDKGQPVTLHGIYVYWFVAENKVTAEQGARMWSMAKTLLTEGVLERWAYVSCFAACRPGQEEAAFLRMTQVIQESAPQFQLAAGESSPVSRARGL